MVFSTKDREPWLKPERRDRLCKYIAGIARNHHAVVLAANGTEDHIHLLVRLEPEVAVSDLLRALKANSSRWVRQTFGELGGFAWQAGFASFTVSESNWKRVAKYIAEQQEHHARLSFAEEFATLLKRHGIAFDPDHYLD
jgi:REP element-mobilizing transposase RayT